MLKNVGAEIVEKISFADHYRYQQKDLHLLNKKAKEHGALLVTTSKDAARMEQDFEQEIKDITIAEMELKFENQNKLEALIETAIHAKAS